VIDKGMVLFGFNDRRPGNEVWEGGSLFFLCHDPVIFLAEHWPMGENSAVINTT
jgi:hypothetical protein